MNGTVAPESAFWRGAITAKPAACASPRSMADPAWAAEVLRAPFRQGGQQHRRAGPGLDGIDQVAGAELAQGAAQLIDRAAHGAAGGDDDVRAAGRHIVLESVAGEYLDRLAKRAEGLSVGNPATEQVALGPLINERQLANVDRIVTETVAAGASVRAGGTHEQLYYRPTVLADVTPDMPAFREEIFGPVAPVIVFKDVDEAVRMANDTEYGLVAAIQTGSMERGLEIADRLRTGIVHVNDQTLNNDAYAPFGGTGSSGNGSRFGSQSSWDEFTQWQWVTARPQAHGFPF